jgi:hypothetical protein
MSEEHLNGQPISFSLLFHNNGTKGPTVGTLLHNDPETY